MAAEVMWWSVFVCSFLTALCVSAICSIAESVLLSLSVSQIVEIGKKNPKIGAIWEKFKKEPNAPITSILAINTTAHTMGSAFSGAAFGHIFSESWLWVFSIIFTFLMLQYTEILPKTFGVRHNQRLAFWIARPLFWATKIGDPIIHFIQFLNKPFERKVEVDESITTVKEITLLTSLARSRSIIDAEQERIILATLKLSKTEVSQVMVPIDEVSFLSDDLTVSNAIEIAKSDSHTRFPVCCRGLDVSIIGYVNFKELITGSSESSDGAWSGNVDNSRLLEYVHEIMYVDYSDKASDILNLLVKNHEHIAMVLGPDKKNSVGIITLEDLVEELVGEIEDEFDRLPEKCNRLSGMVRIGGGLTIEKLIAELKAFFQDACEQCLLELAKEDKFLRVTEWLESKTTENISRNFHYSCGELDFWVKRVRRGRVFDVSVMKKH